MPKYNINIRTSSHIADTLQVDKDDLTSLRAEMARFVGEMLRNHADLIRKDQEWQIDVSDEASLILYVLNIAAMETPATIGTLPNK